MSKKMGLSMLTALSPIRASAMNQISKLGAGNAGRLLGAELGSGAGIKSWWSGKHVGMEGGNLGWGWVGDKAQQAATRSIRQGSVYGGGILLGMNAIVGDEGFLGFAKGTINTGVALSTGYMAKGPLWKATRKVGGIGKHGIRAGAIGAAGYWAGSKLGIF